MVVLLLDCSFAWQPTGGGDLIDNTANVSFAEVGIISISIALLWEHLNILALIKLNLITIRTYQLYSTDQSSVVRFSVSH